MTPLENSLHYGNARVVCFFIVLMLIDKLLILAIKIA